MLVVVVVVLLLLLLLLLPYKNIHVCVEKGQEDIEKLETKKEKRKSKEKEFTFSILRRLEKQVLLFGTSKLSEAAAAAKLGSSAGWNEEVVERAAACLWKIVEEDAKGTFESVMRNCLAQQDVRKPPSYIDWSCSKKNF